MSNKVQAFLVPKEIEVTRQEAQSIYNCLIGYAIANENMAAVTTLPNFIAAWRSKSEKSIVELFNVFRSEDTQIHLELKMLEGQYEEFAEKREQITKTTDADGKEIEVGTGNFTIVHEGGKLKIADAEKNKEYNEALDLFNLEERVKALAEKKYKVNVYRVSASDMKNIKCATSYDGGGEQNSNSRIIFPDYSIMYELIFG